MHVIEPALGSTVPRGRTKRVLPAGTLRLVHDAGAPGRGPHRCEAVVTAAPAPPPPSISFPEISIQSGKISIDGGGAGTDAWEPHVAMAMASTTMAALQMRTRPQRRDRGTFRTQAVATTPEVSRGKPPFERPAGVKHRIAVLGTGWASMTFLSRLQPREDVEVVLVSPRNYFLYTPLLPSAATGAVESRAIVEPVRAKLNGKGFQFYNAECVDVDVDDKVISCVAAGVTQPYRFRMKYDFLVVGVGAVPNTFNVPGVEENCLFLKEMLDANNLRRTVNRRFERAALPGTSEKRIREVLTFVIVGGGPSGVELAAELDDLIQKDIAKTFPPALARCASVQIVELQDHILSTYDRRLAEYATQRFQRNGIKTILNSRVVQVNRGSIVVADKLTNEEREIAFGICVWCTGIRLNPFCNKIMAGLPEGEQQNVRSLTVDKSLCVAGSNGSMFAFGDCATIVRPKSIAFAERMFLKAAGGEDGRLKRPQLYKLLIDASQEFTHLEEAARKLDKNLRMLGMDDAASISGLDFEQFKALLNLIDAGLRALPATAQVAKQQGEFLADFFNANGDDASTIEQGRQKQSFSYKHRGSLAYVGNEAAVMEFPGAIILKGVFAGYVWKGFETLSQFSVRNTMLVSICWLRTWVFGRDISELR